MKFFEKLKKIRLNKKRIFSLAFASFLVLSIGKSSYAKDKEELKGKVVHSFTTKDKPEEIIGKLKAGKKYIIREKRAKEGYEKADDYTFEVGKDGKMQEIKIIDKKIERNVELTKQDTINLKVVPGATVEFENVKTKEKKTATTDSEGKIKITLTYGDWIYHETIAPEGYVKSDKYGKIKVTENGVTIEEVFWNEPITSDYELTKQDTISKKALPGCEVQIKNKETGEVVFKGVTDENGKIKVKLRYGKYILEEVLAPEGYVKATKTLEINVTEHGAKIEQVLYNDKIQTMPKTNLNGGGMIFSILLFVSAVCLVFVFLKKRKMKDE